MLHTIWNNSTIALTSLSSVVLHFERIQVPCTRCSNRRVSTPLPLMWMNYNWYGPRPLNGTLLWHSSRVPAAPAMGDSWKPMKTTLPKEWTITCAQGLMYSTSWPTTRRMNETTCRLSGPTMVWRSPHLTITTIITTPLRMMWLYS